MPTRVPQTALSLLALSFAFAAPALAQEETPEPKETNPVKKLSKIGTN